MIAALARIIEVCFIVPKYAPLEEGDAHSEHTLAEGSKDEGSVTATAGRAFRHLPSFVRILSESVSIEALTKYLFSFSSAQGESIARSPSYLQRADRHPASSSCLPRTRSSSSCTTRAWITSPTSSSCSGTPPFPPLLPPLAHCTQPRLPHLHHCRRPHQPLLHERAQRGVCRQGERHRAHDADVQVVRARPRGGGRGGGGAGACHRRRRRLTRARRRGQAVCNLFGVLVAVEPSSVCCCSLLSNE